MAITLTAFLTVGVVYFISTCYMNVYLDVLEIRYNHNGREGINKGRILGSIFIIFPILIYWVLIQLVLSDPGYVTRKLVNEIY